VTERRKNHNSCQFIIGHDGKVKDQCYKAEGEYKVPKMKKLATSIYRNRPPNLYS